MKGGGKKGGGQKFMATESQDVTVTNVEHWVGDTTGDTECAGQEHGAFLVCWCNSTNPREAKKKKNEEEEEAGGRGGGKGGSERASRVMRQLLQCLSQP